MADLVFRLIKDIREEYKHLQTEIDAKYCRYGDESRSMRQTKCWINRQKYLQDELKTLYTCITGGIPLALLKSVARTTNRIQCILAVRQACQVLRSANS